MKKERFIRSGLATQTGADESTEMFIEIDTETGESEVIIKKTVSCRKPVTELAAAKDLYARLTCGNGRRVFTPEDLAL